MNLINIKFITENKVVQKVLRKLRDLGTRRKKYWLNKKDKGIYNERQPKELDLIE